MITLGELISQESKYFCYSFFIFKSCYF